MSLLMFFSRDKNSSHIQAETTYFFLGLEGVTFFLLGGDGIHNTVMTEVINFVIGIPKKLAPFGQIIEDCSENKIRVIVITCGRSLP